MRPGVLVKQTVSSFKCLCSWWQWGPGEGRVGIITYIQPSVVCRPGSHNAFDRKLWAYLSSPTSLKIPFTTNARMILTSHLDISLDSSPVNGTSHQSESYRLPSSLQALEPSSPPQAILSAAHTVMLIEHTDTWHCQGL